MNTAYTHVSIDTVLKAIFRPAFVLSFGAIVFVAFAVVSVILLHHWRTHGVDKAIMQRVTAIYFSGGLILVGVFIIAGIQLLG